MIYTHPPGIVKPSLEQIASLGGSYLKHPRYHACVGHWMMSAGGGGTVFDLSGYARNGTWNGTSDRWQQDRFGAAGKFNLFDSYLAIDAIDIPTDFTWMAWIKTTVTTLNDAVAFWKLGEASGATRVDSIGSSDLADNATVTQIAGKVGNAAHFTRASSQFLSIADNAALSTGDIDFTFAIWVYLDTKSDNMNILGKWEAVDQREYLFQYETSVDRFRWVVNSDGGAASSVLVVANNYGDVPTGTWVLVIFWHDASANTINIQVNDGAIDSLAHTLGVFDGTSTFKLSSVQSSEFFNGRMDAVGFWKRILTAQEKTQYYNNGNGFQLPYYSTLMSKTPDPWAIYGLQFTVNPSGQLFFGSHSVGNLSTTETLNDGLRHHVGIRFTEPNVVDLFIDGDFLQTAALALTPVANHPLWIGQLPLGGTGGDQMWDDLIEEVRVYDRAVSDGEMFSHAKEPFLEFQIEDQEEQTLSFVQPTPPIQSRISISQP